MKKCFVQGNSFQIFFETFLKFIQNFIENLDKFFLCTMTQKSQTPKINGLWYFVIIMSKIVLKFGKNWNILKNFLGEWEKILGNHVKLWILCKI